MSYQVRRVKQKFGGYFAGMNAYAAKALGFKYSFNKKTVAVVNCPSDIDLPTHETQEASRMEAEFKKKMKHPPRSTSFKDQLEVGIQVEMEHTKDPKVAETIAKDHLKEFSDYYTRLVEMENKAEAEKIYVEEHAQTLKAMGDVDTLDEGRADGKKMVEIARRANGRVN